MRTLKLSMFALVLCMLSMGMGFPDMIIDKELPSVKKPVKTAKVHKAASVSCSSAACCTKKDNGSQTKHRKQQNNALARQANQATTTSISTVYLKLFDKKGNLLLTENLKLEEFLNTEFSSQNLPSGSTFVMFLGNTAYYYLDTTL